jgi:hypothetical protein
MALLKLSGGGGGGGTAGGTVGAAPIMPPLWVLAARLQQTKGST